MYVELETILGMLKNPSSVFVTAHISDISIKALKDMGYKVELRRNFTKIYRKKVV